MLRLASALLLVAIVGVTLWLLPGWAAVVLAAAAAALAAGEVARLAEHVGAGVPAVFAGLTAAAIATAVGTGASGAEAAPGAITAVLLALVVAAGAMALTYGPPTPASLPRASVLVMAPVYVGAPLGAIAWIHVTVGPAATTWLLAVIVASDSAQYYMGRRFGRAKLAPAISPAKTVEGAAGGLAAAGLVGALLGGWALPAAGAAVCAGLAVLLATSGMVGDLFESMLKRSAGVKDSSALIPGHGGLLDRLDSYLFAGPVFYLVLRLLA